MDEGILAVIGGSGAYDLLRDRSLEGPCAGSIETPYGHSAPVHRIDMGDGAAVLFMSRHGEAGYEVTAPYVNYRANIYALKSLGVSHIVSWSGPGAIDPSLEVGQYVVPDDLLDATRGRPSTFFEGKGHGFIRQSPVFCPALRSRLLAACHATGRPVRDGGTYVCTQGPRLETPAEIRQYALLGAHLVGMTLIPESFLARELAMGYAPLCYITNYAEGVREREYEPGTLFEGLATAEERQRVGEALAALPVILRDVARSWREAEPDCACHTSMERFVRSGRVGPDWRTWTDR